MSPTPSLNAQSAPLPPLPDLSGQSSAPGAAQPGNGAFAALLAGITPVKTAVDAINMACKQVVQSGAIPGSEQICAQIIALANQLVPMAAQQAMGGQSAGPAPMQPPGGPVPVQKPQQGPQ